MREFDLNKIIFLVLNFTQGEPAITKAACISVAALLAAQTYLQSASLTGLDHFLTRIESPSCP